MSSHDDRQPVPRTVSRACTESAGTVQALAHEVGVSYAALCSWSRGRRQPPPHRLRRLADVLDVRAERLRDIAVELRSFADSAAGQPRAASGDSPTRPEPADDARSRLGLRIERPSQQRPHREEDATPLPRAAAAPGDGASMELSAPQR